MKKLIYNVLFSFTLLLSLAVGLSGCSSDDGPDYLLQRSDIRVEMPQGGFAAVLNRPFTVTVESVSDQGIAYQWVLDQTTISSTKNLEYTFTSVGNFELLMKVSQGTTVFEYRFPVAVDYSYHLKEEDIELVEPQDGYVAQINQLFRVEVRSASDEGVTYQWFVEEEPVSTTKNFEHMFENGGAYDVELHATQGETTFTYNFIVIVEFGPIDPPATGSSAYITKVLDFMPAVGQFTNQIPRYEAGDTQETINAKVLRALGNNNRGMITLGGYGGYVVVGFDHTIENVPGKRDFRVIGNAFYSDANPDPSAPQGGSCEPGIIMVAYDANANGVPDEDEWYEIAGSSHVDPAGELWYGKAVAAGNDVNTYTDYEITYYKPTEEPQTPEQKLQYIRWEDNKGNSGYKVKNAFHNQPYFPQWVTEDKITFKGTRLPENGVDESGAGSNYVLYKFRYGYADNELNAADESAIDISWAVDSKGRKVNLPGVDFIKIYTGVNQENGWLGECSTDVTGVEDLHILGVDIDTRP